MKLSTVKKFGAIHVHGGKLVRVVHDHAIGTKGFCQVMRQVSQEGGYAVNRTVDLAETVTARAGDLALEIVQHKTEKLLGYTYLTGDAIQLNTYQLRPDRYEPAVIAPARLIPPTQEQAASDEGFNEYIRYFNTQCFEMRSDQTVDVFSLDVQGIGPAEGKNLADSLVHGFSIVPKDWTDEQVSQYPFRAHLVASIHAGRGKKAQHYHLHMQPKIHASDCAITPFQAQLCHTSIARNWEIQPP